VGQEQHEGFRIYEDIRGVGISFSVQDVQNLHAASVNPGAVRGNHFHDQEEVLCIMGGRSICQIEIRDKSKDFEKKIIAEKDVEAFVIPKGCIHTVRNKGEKAFFLVSFLRKKRNKQGS